MRAFVDGWSARGESQPLKARELPRDVSSIHIVRLLAAIHICYTHTLCPKYDPGAAHYAGSWLTFFFALSGFGPAYSKLLTWRRAGGTIGLVQPSQRLSDVPRTLLRRWISVYPTYLLALLMSVVAAAKVDAAPWQKPQLWPGLATDALLLQAYFPADVKVLGSNIYNMPAWYVSAMVVLWLLEGPCYALGACCARRGWAGLAAGALLCVTWAIFWPWAAFDPLWRCSENWHSWRDVQGLRYWHCYLAGVLLAFVVHARAERQRPPVVWAATVAVALLAALFSLNLSWVGLRQPTEWVQTNLIDFSGLLPLYCLLIWGLAEGADPLARLFALRPLPLVGRHLAYGVYVLQSPVHTFMVLYVGGVFNPQPWQVGCHEALLSVHCPQPALTAQRRCCRCCPPPTRVCATQLSHPAATTRPRC